MIVQVGKDDLVLVCQVDHQVLAGELFEAWGRLPFDRPPPYVGLVYAAFWHDEGWRDWEAEPKVDPGTRLPYQFTDMPVEEHLTFYRKGIERVTALHPYAGLLVNMHCVGLYQNRFGKLDVLPPKERTPEEQAVIRRFVRELEDEQARITEGLGLPAKDATLWMHYTLLQVFDLLSLYFCMGPPRERKVSPVPTKLRGLPADVTLLPRDGGTVRVSPYPFRQTPLPVRVPARVVPNRPYAGDDEFREAFAAARTIRLEFELVPE